MGGSLSGRHVVCHDPFVVDLDMISKDNLPPGYKLSNGRQRVQWWLDRKLSAMTFEEHVRFIELNERVKPGGGGLDTNELSEYRWLEFKGLGGMLRDGI